MPDGYDEPLRVPLESIERVQLSRGRSSNTLRGLGLGAAIGAGSGLILGLVARTGDDNPLYNHSPVVTALGGATVGGALGGIIGVTIGVATKSERWSPLKGPDPARAAPPAAAELRVGISLTF